MSDSESSSGPEQVADRRTRSTSGSSVNSSEDELEYDSLNEFDKVLLQSVQRIGILNDEQMKTLIVEIGNHVQKPVEPEDVTAAFIQEKIDTISKSIMPFNMTIQKVVCEVSETAYYMFHATVESPIMKFQTFFTRYEAEVFKKVMTLLLRKSTNYEARFGNLRDVVATIEIDSKGEKSIDEILQKYIEMKYLIVTSNDHDIGDRDCKVTLGIRAIREMEPILQDSYKDQLGNCGLCKTFLLHGFRCVKCDFVFHRHCFKAFIEKTTQCPNRQCKVQLCEADEMPVRTREVEDEQDVNNGMDSTEEVSSNLSSNSD